MHFLLVCLSTLKPKHRFFGKGYKPPAPKRKSNVLKPKLDLPIDFFYGQPPLTPRMIKKSSCKTHNMLLKI